MATDIHYTLTWSPSNASIIARNFTITQGSTITDALAHAHAQGIELPADWQTAKVGIYGKLKPRDTVLREGDRIELHRALKADPKEARRLRAHRHPIKKKRVTPPSEE